MTYSTATGRRACLRVIPRMSSEPSEAWHLVNGYSYRPEPCLPPPAPGVIDYRDIADTAHPVRSALASLAILAVIVMLCACWAVRS